MQAQKNPTKENSKKKNSTTPPSMVQIEPEVVTTTTDQQSPEVISPETLNEKIEKLSVKIKELTEKISSSESSKKNELRDKQQILIANLELLSKAEQRAENLRQKLFELTEKENSIKAQISQIDLESNDEVINRSVALMGGLKPEVFREQKIQSLQAQKNNLLNLLTQIQNYKAKLEENLSKADQIVEKLRTKLEREIDEALEEKP
jgi:DNA repair exonuclease SbcCD ATPase subunit